MSQESQTKKKGGRARSERGYFIVYKQLQIFLDPASIIGEPNFLSNLAAKSTNTFKYIIENTHKIQFFYLK
jgi:hypothetical protein